MMIPQARSRSPSDRQKTRYDRGATWHFAGLLMKDLTTSDEMTNALEAALEGMTSGVKYNVPQFIDHVSNASSATFSNRLFIDALEPLIASGRVRRTVGRLPSKSTIVAWYEFRARVYS